MYVRRIKTDGKTWSLVSQRGKHLISSYYRNCAPTQTSSSAPILESCMFQGTLNRRHLLDTFKSTSIGYGRTHIRLLRRSDVCLSCSQLRFYSSEGDGRNASEDKHARTIEQPSSDKAKTWKQKVGEQVRHCDGHAELGELEQKEWLCNEKLSIDSKKKESPFLPRRERFKNEFLRRIVPWEKIAVSWDTFPYYVHEHTKSLLVECAASHLKHRKLTMDYGGHLNSSSGRIMLQSIPGTELYRERFVRAVAKDLKVPLLVLDNSILASYDFGEDCSSESESDEDAESAEEYASESEVDDATDAANEEEWASSGEARSEASDDERDVQASAEALKKLVPYNLEDFEKRVSGESDDSSESPSSEAVDSSENTKRPFRKGDRVKYVGPSVIVEADNRIVLGKIATSDGPTNAYTVIRGRTLSSGQRGEVYELGADQVAVILDISETKMDGQKDEKPMAEDAKPSVYWIPGILCSLRCLYQHHSYFF
nr:Spastin like [Ipomoea batatas]